MVPADENVSILSAADLRRGQILVAAAACFNREGFHGASMASIAEEARVSVGQIYRYFENKEAVIAALVEQHMDEWAARMAALRARSSGAVDFLVEMARLQAEKVCDSGRAALSLEFLAEAARNPRIAEIVRGVDGAVLAQVKDALISAGVRDDAALASRLTIVATLIDGWTLRAVKDPDADREGYLAALRPLLETLLRQDG